MEIGIIYALVSQEDRDWRERSEGERQFTVSDVAYGGSKKRMSQTASETVIFDTQI